MGEIRTVTTLESKRTKGLAAIGVKDTDVNIRNKIARGGFTAVFLVQCLEAVGVKELRLN